MRSPSIALILLIASLIAVPAVAGPYEDATKAYERGDYKTAFRLIKPLAEAGIVSEIPVQPRSSCTRWARACGRTTPRR